MTPHVSVTLAYRVVAGTAVALVGFATTAVGFLSFRRASTTIDPVRIDGASKLVTAGIYQITRNPMYVGMALMLVGVGVALGSPPSLIGPLAFVGFITRYQILPEEHALLAKFGSVYAAYRENTRRWI